MVVKLKCQRRIFGLSANQKSFFIDLDPPNNPAIFVCLHDSQRGSRFFCLLSQIRAINKNVLFIAVTHGNKSNSLHCHYDSLWQTINFSLSSGFMTRNNNFWVVVIHRSQQMIYHSQLNFFFVAYDPRISNELKIWQKMYNLGFNRKIIHWMYNSHWTVAMMCHFSWVTRCILQLKN